MNDFEIVDSGKTIYIHYPVDENEQIDSTDIGMLLGNSIDGIAPLALIEQEGQLTIRYDIGQKESLSELIEAKVSEGGLIVAMRKMTAAILHAEDYLLDVNGYYFDSRFVFFSKELREMALLYIPIEEYTSEITFWEYCGQLIDEYLKNEHSTKGYLNEVRLFISQNKENLSRLLKLLEQQEIDIMTGRRKGIVLIGEEKVSAGPNTEMGDNSLRKSNERQSGPVILQERKRLNIAGDESFPLPKQTHILQKATGQDICKRAGLVRESTGEEIIVTGVNFIIGSSPELCQYCVPNNSLISRRHARIVKASNDAYSIQDILSTNGTYVDEQRLEAGQTVMLRSGSKIQLANEMFTFRILT